MPAQVAIACVFLFCLDRFSPGPTWFLPLAMPVTLLVGAVVALALTRRQEGWPVPRIDRRRGDGGGRSCS